MSEEEVSTKEKIIQAVFALLKTNSYSSLSLSRIAKEVSISKTAIYRHFKSKEDLSGSIQKRIFELIYDNMKEVDALYHQKKYAECITSALRFLKAHPEILNYAFFSSPDVGEDKKLYRYCDEGVELMRLFYDENHKIKDYVFYSKGLFVGTTLIVFLLGWFKAVRDGFYGPNPESVYPEFESYILKIISDGFKAPENLLSDADFAKLDELCNASMSSLPDLDTKLVALANVVAKVGFPNVTVEAVANELGMVKSSLYTWFSDKQQMLNSLIAPELNMMLTTVLQNMNQVSTSLEKLYVLLKTETVYFITRKKMLSACKWIQITGNYNKEGFANVIDPEISMRVGIEVDGKIAAKAKELYKCFNPNLLGGWVFSFPVFLVVNAIHHDFSETDLNDSLRRLFNMIAGGLTLDKISIKGGNI